MDKYIRMNIIYTSALFDILIWNSISNSLSDRQQLLLSLLLNDKCKNLSNKRNNTGSEDFRNDRRWIWRGKKIYTNVIAGIFLIFC